MAGSNPQHEESYPPSENEDASTAAFFEQAQAKRQVYSEAAARDKARIAANRERLGGEMGDELMDAFVREHQAHVEREEARRREEGNGAAGAVTAGVEALTTGDEKPATDKKDN